MTDMKEAKHCASYNISPPEEEVANVSERVEHYVRLPTNSEKEIKLGVTPVGNDFSLQPILDHIAATGGWAEQRLVRDEGKRKQTLDSFKHALDKLETDLRKDIVARYPNTLEEEGYGCGLYFYYHSCEITTPARLGRKEHERRRAILQRFLKEQGAEWTGQCSTKYPNDVCERVDDKAADLSIEQITEASIDDQLAAVVGR